MSARFLVVHLHRALGEFTRELERMLGVAGVAVGVIDHMGDRDRRVRGDVIGVDGDGALEQTARRDIAGSRRRRRLLAAAQIELEGLDIDVAPRRHPFLLADRQLALQRRDDLFGEFVLDGEDIGEVSIEPVGPDVARRSRESINCAVTRTRLPALRTLPSST